jgi:hypothetical protein
MYPYNYKRGQRIQSDAGVAVDRAFLANYKVLAADAVATSNTAVRAAVTLGAAAQDVTTEIVNPATPRNLIVKGNAAGIVGDVVIEGTNYAGEAITETIALNASTAVEGNKAFRTVTKITLPAKTNASGDTVSVGFGNKLGLPYKLAHNTVLLAFLDNAKEGTAPTVTVSATALESNTAKLNSALNGKDVNLYLMV